LRSHSSAYRPQAVVPEYFGWSAGTRRQRSLSWRVLQRNREFRYYFAGCAASDFGTWCQNAAQVILAYKLSHSALAVGLVTCAQYSSPLLLSAWAGVMTHKLGGYRTLLATQWIAAVCSTVIAGLVFFGPINGWELAAGAIASGLAFTFALPARNVTVRRLVSPADVEPAFGMDSVSYNLGRAVAPPLSVLLVTTAGFGWAFALNAVSFAVFAVFLLRAGPGHDEPRNVTRWDTRREANLWHGLVSACHDWEIAIPLLMVAAVTVADDPVLVLGPALTSHMHVAASWAGWFIAALGAGTVAGSFRPSRHNPSLRKAATALGALAVCMICFTQSPWAWGSLAAAFGAGAACLAANSTTKTLLTTKAGPAREASVMAVWAIAWAGSKPVASLADGLLAGRIGLKWTGFLLAMPALIPVLVLVALLVIVYIARAVIRWDTFARCRTWLSAREWVHRAEAYLVGTEPGSGGEPPRAVDGPAAVTGGGRLREVVPWPPEHAPRQAAQLPQLLLLPYLHQETQLPPENYLPHQLLAACGLEIDSKSCDPGTAVARLESRRSGAQRAGSARVLP
jgi:predicted MFS family arabinose efflux permease